MHLSPRARIGKNTVRWVIGGSIAVGVGIAAVIFPFANQTGATAESLPPSPQRATVAPTPAAAEPVDPDAARGRELARKAYTKPEFYGEASDTPILRLPVRSSFFDALPKDDRSALGSFMASATRSAQRSPAPYMLVPRSAPAYKIVRAMASRVTEWEIRDEFGVTLAAGHVPRE